MRRRIVEKLMACTAVVAMALGLVSLAALPGCFEEVGASDNQEQVGRQDRGRGMGSYHFFESAEETGDSRWDYSVSYEDVVLSPDGRSLLAMVPIPGPGVGFDQPGMMLAVYRLPFGTPVYFPEIRDISRLNFAPDGGTAYALPKSGRKVYEIDLVNFAITKEHLTTARFGVVDVSPSGRYLVLTNLPTSDWLESLFGGGNSDCQRHSTVQGSDDWDVCEFEIIDLQEETHVMGRSQWRLRDLDFVPGREEILTTCSNFVGGRAHAYVDFVSLADGDVIEGLDFTNCADEMVIDKQRNLALLAPVDCIQDPISVIDMESRTFVKNLPGYGPVVIAEDSSVAVGFTDRSILESDWGYHDQTTEYGLIFVNLDTLDYEIMDNGDVAPTYTLSPDGSRLYIYEHATKHWNEETGQSEWGDGGLYRMDMTTHEKKRLGDRDYRLDRFVWTDDGSLMYFLNNEFLYSLDVSTDKVTPIPLYVRPELMNIRPQQDYLVLGEEQKPVFHLLSMETGQLSDTIDLSYPVVAPRD